MAIARKNGKPLTDISLGWILSTHKHDTQVAVVGNFIYLKAQSTMLATFGWNLYKTTTTTTTKNTSKDLIKMHTQIFYYSLTVCSLPYCRVKTQYMTSQTEVKFTVTIHTWYSFTCKLHSPVVNKWSEAYLSFEGSQCELLVPMSRWPNLFHGPTLGNYTWKKGGRWFW